MKINITVRRRQQWEVKVHFNAMTASKEMLIFIAASIENVRI